jgi:hypothetical protein
MWAEDRLTNRAEGAVMNLGFIESKTYDEISVGDTAKTEHVLTTDDAMAFASISARRWAVRQTGSIPVPASSTRFARILFSPA